MQRQSPQQVIATIASECQVEAYTDLGSAALFALASQHPAGRRLRDAVVELVDLVAKMRGAGLITVPFTDLDADLAWVQAQVASHEAQSQPLWKRAGELYELRKLVLPTRH